MELGDFTVTPRVIMLSAIALFIGVVCSFVKWSPGEDYEGGDRADA
jgi:hypothetical protein